MRTTSIRLVITLLVAGPLLAACASDFDPTDWTDKLDFFHLNDKKKLPGERKEMFPGGVPGVQQGIPSDLVKGYQPPAAAEQQQEQQQEKQQEQRQVQQEKPKPKPRVAHKPPAKPKPTQVTVSPQQQQTQRAQPAWPDPKPQAQQQQQTGTQAPWPSPQQQPSAWPDAPPPNTFQR